MVVLLLKLLILEFTNTRKIRFKRNSRPVSIGKIVRLDKDLQILEVQ